MPIKKKGGAIDNKGILLSTLQDHSGQYKVIHPCVVTGRSIRSINLINSMLSSVSRIFGGKQDWTGVEDLLDTVRDEAVNHMIEKALSYEPDAILGIFIELSEIASSRSDALLVCTVTGTMCKEK